MSDNSDSLSGSSGTALADVGEKIVVSTGIIPSVTQVYCYEETLPLIAEKHPELDPLVPSLEHAIHDTIAAPTKVLQSNTEIHTAGYRFASTNHRRGEQHLVVAVKVIEGTSALLKTAYFTAATAGTVLYDAGADGDDDV